MSEIPYFTAYEMHFDDGIAQCIQWPRMKNGDAGTPYHMPIKADRSVQFAGNFGTGGGKVQFQGTDIPSPDQRRAGSGAQEWFVLTDTLGALLETTIAKGRQVVEVVHEVRPVVVAGDNSEAIDVYLYLILKRR